MRIDQFLSEFGSSVEFSQRLARVNDIRIESLFSRNGLCELFYLCAEELDFFRPISPPLLNFFHGIWWCRNPKSLSDNELHPWINHLVVNNEKDNCLFGQLFPQQIIYLPHPILMAKTFAEESFKTRLNLIIAPHHRFPQPLERLIMGLDEALDSIGDSSVPNIVLMHPADERYRNQLKKRYCRELTFVDRAGLSNGARLLLHCGLSANASRYIYFEPSSAGIIGLFYAETISRIILPASIMDPRCLDHSSIAPIVNHYLPLASSLIKGKKLDNLDEFLGISALDGEHIKSQLEIVERVGFSTKEKLLAVEKRIAGLSRALYRRILRRRGLQVSIDPVEASFALNSRGQKYNAD